MTNSIQPPAGGFSRRSFLGLGAAAISATALSACGAGGTSPGTGSSGAAGGALTVLCEAGGQAELTPIANAFTKDTGTAVTFVALPYEGLYNRFNTELSAGLVETPAFKNSTVGDVADAVIHALQHNRFDVYVPRSVGVTWATMNLVPRRARDLVGRALKIDRALTEADHNARAAYEARAAASAPAAETEGRDTAGV